MGIQNDLIVLFKYNKKPKEGEEPISLYKYRIEPEALPLIIDDLKHLLEIWKQLQK